MSATHKCHKRWHVCRHATWPSGVNLGDPPNTCTASWRLSFAPTCKMVLQKDPSSLAPQKRRFQRFPHQKNKQKTKQKKQNEENTHNNRRCAKQSNAAKPFFQVTILAPLKYLVRLQAPGTLNSQLGETKKRGTDHSNLRKPFRPAQPPGEQTPFSNVGSSTKNQRRGEGCVNLASCGNQDRHGTWAPARYLSLRSPGDFQRGFLLDSRVCGRLPKKTWDAQVSDPIRGCQIGLGSGSGTSLKLLSGAASCRTFDVALRFRPWKQILLKPTRGS